MTNLIDALSWIHTLIGRLGGKKFLVALFAIFLLLTNQHIITLTDSQLKMVCDVAAWFGIGQAAADIGTKGLTSSVYQNFINDGQRSDT
jgi:hypothetical protein